MSPSPTTRPAVIVIGELSGGRPPGIERVADRVELRFAVTKDQVEAALPGAEVALLWDFGSTLLRESLDRAEALRWVHVAAAGVDAVMGPELTARDITLTNAAGVFDRSIAETVAGWVLMFAKDTLGTIGLQRTRTWRHRETEMAAGASALVIGMGGIGREIGRILQSLRLEVTAVASSERSDPDFGTVRSIDDLDELLPGQDYVVLVLPLTNATRGLIGSEQLRAMRPSARLINVGRGGLVDEQALVEALGVGEISGAALDVFAEEPLPEDSPLWDMPNALVSPHMSADFHGWLDALADQFIDNLDRWLQGDPLKKAVDKDRGYVPGDGGRSD